ncbi:transcription factor Spi-B-like isoform X2 [Eriocheir sinensis]|nr:transcription factor Spi-B-like isoform X2 [Eriocheir sinensis]
MYNEAPTTNSPHAGTYHYFPVSQWSNEQVLEWLRQVCHENNIGCDNLTGFTDCTGHQLCSMTQAQFSELHPLHGALFFRKLREFSENQQRQERYHYHHHHYRHHPHHHHHHHQASPPPPQLIQHPANGTTFHELLPRHPAGHPNLNPWQDSTPPPHTPHYQPTEHYYPSEGALTPTTDYGGVSMGGYQPAYPLHNEFESSTISPPVHLSTPNAHQGYLPAPLPSGPPHGVPPSSPTPSEVPSPLCYQQETRRDRGPKLWEFLLDLLEDPNSNPSIIRWENQGDRTFRLTSPHEVSYRWGQRRPSQNALPYDYFARALRYHYRTGMLISVPERKLVYKFGPAVFQQRRRGPNSPSDNTPGHPSP